MELRCWLLVRKNIKIQDNIENARLYITAKGLFQAYINGKQIGEDVLSPGWTSYQKRIETLTYDVSSLLKKGKNAMGLELAEGWHSGRLIFRSYAEVSPQVLAQLEVKYKNGETETFVTNNTWKGTVNGPTQYSSIYDGECYDENAAMPGWSTSGFNDSVWISAEEESISPQVKLVPKQHNPVKTKIELPTQSITEPTKGSFVFDLGQNMAGVAKIELRVKKGQKVKIRFAEMLQPNGEIYTKNYRSAVSTDFYIPAKNGVIEWQPKFTFHGFRYVEVSGFDESATPEESWVTGLVQYSDFEMAGTFASSHSKLNQLQSNIEWGLRGNFLDIPTDCPQRDERAGWTGDAQVFIPTSMFIANAHSFWASWMQSLRDDQRENGSIPIVVPDIDGKRVSSGWGDAATVVPWEMYLRTGFLGTPLLAPVLEKIGRTDLMFEMLFKETYPSWFYSINQGATTMWERWNSYTHQDGFNPGGMNSFNHYAYGAIGQFMYERIAGISPLKPGYKEILISPLPVGPLNSAKASYNSPYGLISVDWKHVSGVLKLEAKIPPNTTAKVVVPADISENLMLNGSPFAAGNDVKLLKKTEKAFEMEVQPGNYVFETKL